MHGNTLLHVGKVQEKIICSKYYVQACEALNNAFIIS